MAAQVRVTPQAKAIHDSAIVIDTHADTTQYFLDPAFDLAFALKAASATD